jgi:hypothetical protein
MCLLQLEILADSDRLQRDIHTMTSQFVQLRHGTRPTRHESTSCSRDVTTKPPRCRRHRTRPTATSHRRSATSDSRRPGSSTDSRRREPDFEDDEDKENRCVDFDARHVGRQELKTRTLPVTNNEPCSYQSYLSSVVASYLSPMRIRPPTKPESGWFSTAPFIQATTPTSRYKGELYYIYC